MKEFEQESIVVEDKDTYRGLVILGSMIMSRAQATVDNLKRYNDMLVESIIEGKEAKHENDEHKDSIDWIGANEARMRNYEGERREAQKHARSIFEIMMDNRVEGLSKVEGKDGNNA